MSTEDQTPTETAAERRAAFLGDVMEATSPTEYGRAVELMGDMLRSTASVAAYYVAQDDDMDKKLSQYAVHLAHTFDELAPLLHKFGIR